MAFVRFLLNRIAQALVTVFLVSLAVFWLFQIIPGDPVLALLGDSADPALEAALRAQYHLDRPAPARYAEWAAGVLRGDLGTSIRFNRPVGAMILERLPSTLTLSGMSLLIVVFAGVPLGIAAARFSGKRRGALFNIVTQIGASIPSFFLAILLILLFSLKLGWFNVIGYVPWSEDPAACIKGFFLPALAIAAAAIASLARYTRASVLEQLGMDYVRTARGKGLTRRRILYGHVLRNALVPVLTMFGILLTGVLSGVIVVEAAFSIPGIGNLLHGGIKNRDLPLVQGISLYISVVVVFVFFLIDLLYRVIDPRIGNEREGGAV
ncbi:MAG: ABC transporter permease [Clostridiales bacterium]|nr:ABC transporter permease [Clostridiales bacterium]